MTTKAKMITLLKEENPTLRIGNDDEGYTELSQNDYDATIEAWAEARLAKEAAAAAKAKAEADKAAVLARLGLTEDEAKLLLS